MKKIIKDSIKIMLIATLICSFFCPIVTVASQASFAIGTKVRIVDEVGNAISSMRVYFNNEYDIVQTTDSSGYVNFGYSFKLYESGESKQFTVKLRPSVDGGSNRGNWPDINLTFKAIRGANNALTLTGPNDEFAESTNLDYCIVDYSISSLHDEVLSDVNITIKLKKKVVDEPVIAPNIDCSVNIGNVSEINNAVQVVSNAESSNASISVADMIQHLKSKGITIQQITDVSGNSINLSSTQLLGTGAVLKASDNTNYTSIVYGDATGDGQVNAADISVVINNFLGTDTNISKAANIAADVQQDGELNAADISLMINSFLGNLDGDILKKSNISSEDKVGKKISEVVKVGDYINYPVNYTNVPTQRGNMTYDMSKPTDTGWRVCSNKDGTVKLMPAGCPENVSASQIDAYVSNISNFNKYLVKDFATSIYACPNADDEAKVIDDVKLSWFGTLDSSLGGTSCSIWKRYDGNKIGISSSSEGDIYNSFYNAGEEYNSFGVMPVVTLKSDLINHGGDGTKANPYKLAE